jgi:hypothetical protein
VLQRELELEWVAELAVPRWSPATLAPPLRLPEEPARQLLQLARLGHRQGLLAALDRLVDAHPSCAAQVVVLRELVERFAWDELAGQLGGALAHSDAQTL